MLLPDTLAINRLSIKGDKRSNQKLAKDFIQSSWAMPVPAHLRQAWVFVRQINVSGKLHSLRQQTAQVLDSQIQKAVNAKAAHSSQANAIWFESFPVLLAFLLRDLALGNAVQWYWDKWAYLLKYPRGEAITRLLCEYPEYLIAVFDELIKTGHLTTVLKQISSQSALTVARELSRNVEIPDISFHAVPSADPEHYQTISQALLSLQPVLASWQPFFISLGVENKTHDYAKNGHQLLALLYIGLNYTPLFLYQQPSLFGQAVNSHFYKSADSVKNYNQEKKQDTGVSFYKLQQDKKQQENKSKNDNKLPTHVDDKEKRDQIRIDSTEQDNSSIDGKEQEALSDINKTPSKIRGLEKSEVSHHKIPQDATKQDSYYQEGVNSGIAEETSGDNKIVLDGNSFVTALGGFFYLLNPINRLLTKELIDKHITANGWQWLLDIYTMFKTQYPSLAVFKDTALELFLSKQKNSSQQESKEFSQYLFQQLQSHYCEHPFWKELQSEANFIAVQAQVVATASHIDVYYSLQSTRLDLRLAAWDVNPGWLPWLGRVVKFHYCEDNIDKNEQQG